MSPKVISLPRRAEPGIQVILGEFLDEQRARLAPRTLARYEDVLDLFRSYLNRYGHESLTRTEAALFDRGQSGEGEEHLEFCDLFGADKIAGNLNGFLGYFLIRKVVAGEDLLRVAGTVMKRLSKWLLAQGYASPEDTAESAETCAAARRNLPRAARAAQILREASHRRGIDAVALAEKDYREFDHYGIARVEPGLIWLEVMGGRRASRCGPVQVPESATERLRCGWSISCALGRVGGSWHLLDVANVYPE